VRSVKEEGVMPAKKGEPREKGLFGMGAKSGDKIELGPQREDVGVLRGVSQNTPEKKVRRVREVENAKVRF